ncbi:MAG TPA: hypothetical protein DCS93_39575 [Microscillaceae bacterium]|nr:hypothetical protein [Microscillaceae bacterium]
MFQFLIKLVKCCTTPQTSKICYLLLWSLAWANINAQNKVFLRNTFTEEATGGSKFNFWITEGEQGALLVANVRGLLVYQGQDWQLHAFKNQQGEVISLQHLLPQKNKIWVAGSDGVGFLEKAAGKYTYHSLMTGQYAQEKLAVANQIISFQDQVFFVYVNKIIVVRQNKITQILKSPKGTLFGYLFQVEKDLYLSQYGKGLLVWEKDHFVLKNGAELYRKGFVYLRQKNVRGIINAISTKGLWVEKNDTTTKIALPTAAQQVLSKGVVHPRFINQDELVFGTFKGDAYWLNLKTGKIQQIFSGNSFIRSIYIDRQKNVWLVNDNNIHQIEISSAFSLMLPRQHLLEVVSTKRGLLGYSLAADSVFWINEAEEIVKMHVPGRIQTICAIQEPQLLVGTTQGIYLVDYTTQAHLKLLEFGNNRCMAQDAIQPDIFYLSTTRGIFVVRLENRQFKILAEITNLELNVISILRTQKHLWLGTGDSGVIRFDIDLDSLSVITNKKIYNAPNGALNKNDKTSFLHFWQGKVWVNNPGGIYTYSEQQDKFTPIQLQRADTTQDFFSSLVAFQGDQILVSGQSNTFSVMGMAHKTQKQSYTFVPTPFKRLPKYEFGALVTFQGKFYAATSKGLLCYDPKKPKNYQASFQTLLSKAAQQGTFIAPGTILDYAKNTVRFEFASNYLEAPQKTQFAYHLEGLNQQWSVWSSENKKEFNNLREGKYTFKVKARNVYGVEGKVASFSFEILPPWYRSRWAYGLYAIGALLSIYGFFRIYTYRIRLRNRQLEQQVQTRTRELNETNEELTTANEQLKELDELKESFSQMLIHDARQPLIPIMTSTDPVVQDAGWRLKTFFDNFLEVQKFEAAEVQLYTQTVSLGALVGEALTQLRFSATQKMITITNYIPAEITVRVDEAYILRVFTNLIGNAIKYIPASGHIALEATPVTDQQFIKVWVKDNGTGVPDALKNTIFDKFTRANKADKRSTGLGLTFCKMVVEAHGGHIGVLTQTEQQQIGESGGAFWLTLPYEEKTVTAKSKETSETISVQYRFTLEDKALVKEVLPQLERLEFCDSSDIAAVFDDRPWQGSEALEAWIDALPFMQNQQDYLNKLKEIT